MRKKLCGVYRFLNSVTGKSYVGSAVDINGRKSVHLATLRAGRHHSGYLQNSWNKHGESAFSFLIIERCGPSELTKLEQFWMDKLSSVTPGGYNIHPKARTSLGFKHSEEVCELLSKMAKARSKRPGDSEARSRRAKLQHKSGNFGRRTWTKESEESFAACLSIAYKGKRRVANKWTKKSRMKMRATIKRLAAEGKWLNGSKFYRKKPYAKGFKWSEESKARLSKSIKKLVKQGCWHGSKKKPLTSGRS